MTLFRRAGGACLALAVVMLLRPTLRVAVAAGDELESRLTGQPPVRFHLDGLACHDRWCDEGKRRPMW